jgi:hypothetical protein
VTVWCESLRGRLLCASAKLEAKNSKMKSACFKNVLARQAENFNENTDKNHALSLRSSAMVTKQQRDAATRTRAARWPRAARATCDSNTVPAASNPAAIEIDYDSRYTGGCKLLILQH